MSDRLRPFAAPDLAAIVALDNAELPAIRHSTTADWAAADRRRPAGNCSLRLVAGDPPVAFLEVEDMATAAPSFRSVRGICELMLVVDRAHRRRGIGGALYQRAIRFAQQRGATMLRAWVYHSTPDDPGPLFLARRGFVETARRQTAHLDLATFDAARCAAALRAVDQQGIRILSYGELPDSLANRHKLFDLYIATGFQAADANFEAWAAAQIDNADWSVETVLIAEHGASWIGLTRTQLQNCVTGAARITATATLPEWRGRGIATALKTHGIAALRAQGGTVLLTSNRVDNAPILAVNRKLGYVPGPLELTLDKLLDP